MSSELVQLPTFDNNSCHRRGFPFYVEGWGTILGRVDEITAENERHGRAWGMTTVSSNNYIQHEESQWSSVCPSSISTVYKCWGLTGRVKRLPTSWSPGSACCNCSLQCISQDGPWHRSARCSCTLKKEERQLAYFSLDLRSVRSMLVNLENISPGNPGFGPPSYGAVQLQGVAFPDCLPTGPDDKLRRVCQAVRVHFLAELWPLFHLHLEGEDCCHGLRLKVKMYNNDMNPR